MMIRFVLSTWCDCIGRKQGEAMLTVLLLTLDEPQLLRLLPRGVQSQTPSPSVHPHTNQFIVRKR